MKQSFRLHTHISLQTPKSKEDCFNEKWFFTIVHTVKSNIISQSA